MVVQVGDSELQRARVAVRAAVYRLDGRLSMLFCRLARGVVLASVGMLPCMLVYSIGLAGALYCYKSMLVDGNMDVRKRFGAGIRKNGLKYLLFAFIIWLSLSLAVITPTLYSYIGAGLLYGAGIAASVIQAAVLVPAMCLAAVECGERGRGDFRTALRPPI